MISVVLALWNGEERISAQIESILSQLSADDELIVVDDCSKDLGVVRVEEFNDRRIKIFTHSENQGVVASFNDGLKIASGEIIFLSDQDDIWYPQKVQEVKRALESSICVLHDSIVTDGNGAVLERSYIAMRSFKTGFWRNVFKNGYSGCMMAFRRELLQSILPLPEGLNHDQWIGLLAELRGVVYTHPTPLMEWQRHGKTATDIFAKKGFGDLFKLIIYRLNLLYHLSTRYLSWHWRSNG